MAHSVQRKSSRSAIPSPAIELRSSSPSSSGARMALLRLFRGTFRRPPRPCARPHGTTSAGGLVVWRVKSTAKAVSGTRSRRTADWGRSRAIAQRGPFGPVHEAAAAHRGRVQRRAAGQLSYEATQYITWVTSGAMAHAASRVGVARARSCHSVTGRLRRVHSEATRAHGGRVERRVGTRLGFGQLIPSHTRPTVPWGRSRAALGAGDKVAQILVISEMTRGGRGLSSRV